MRDLLSSLNRVVNDVERKISHAKYVEQTWLLICLSGVWV